MTGAVVRPIGLFDGYGSHIASVAHLAGYLDFTGEDYPQALVGSGQAERQCAQVSLGSPAHRPSLTGSVWFECDGKRMI